MVSDKTYYYGEGESRRQDIANWYKELVRENSYAKALGTEIKGNIEKVKTGELKLSQVYTLFLSQLRSVLKDDSSFSYLIYHNKQRFGNKVVTDIFKRTYFK